ncbi:MAG: response regulator [Labilithrix sp.]|nr:response regulator [Labilithrix sp.]
MKIAPDQLLTSSEVGVLLQVNPSSVKKWVDDGLIQAFRTPGGHRRIRPSDLVEFLHKHRMPIPRDLQDAARRRLLIVDDDVTQLKALGRALSRHSDRIEVVTTANGIDALVLVGSFQPNLVILDVFMPGIDGLEVCRRLKANPETRGIHVIIVSGHVTAPLKKKALEAGAVSCLNKPVDVQELLSILEETSPVEAGAL